MLAEHPASAPMYVLLALVLLVPAAASAQGTGTLAGRITDDTGEGLPGAHVVVDGTTLGAATDVDGTYRVIGVPAGTHAVTASFVGYAPAHRTGVDVRSGHTRALDLALTLDPLAPAYTISVPLGPGARYLVPDVFTPRVVSGEEIRRLPLDR